MWMSRILGVLQNSSYPTKVEFNNCFIIYSKYFLVLKGASPFRSIFLLTKNNTTSFPGFLGQRFNNQQQRAALLTSFGRHWFNIYGQEP